MVYNNIIGSGGLFDTRILIVALIYMAINCSIYIYIC